MSKKYTTKNIKLEDLVLDKENPRFAELYNGSDKESDIVEYLLYTESADEVAEAISVANEFYEDRPLWVFKEDGSYIVKDGNRRCSAVKALQLPNKYGLDIPKFEINELPVLEYNNLADLETRIRLEHNSSLFKKWGRIAKALEIYRLFSSGSSIESLTDIDSNPKEFIKIATFYHKAVNIKGEDFKKLVREGRGKTGGKTIVFERLFKSRSDCGYNFKRKTSEIMIKDNELFTSYVNAIVPYLIDNPDTTSRVIDTIGTDNFLLKLKPYGFPPKKPVTASTQSSLPDSNSTNSGATASSTSNVTNGNSTTNSSLTSNSDATTTSTSNPTNDSHTTNSSSTSNTNQNNQTTSTNTNSSNTTNSANQGNTTTRHSVKHKPSLKRKQIPPALKKLIDECYNLDENNFANAKTALTRVTLECTLKYVVENTKKVNGNPIKSANHFDLAFRARRGTPLSYTNFDILKTKFTELITDVGIRKAFEDFDMQNPHQIIHNYRVSAVPANAKALCDNLIDLLEFMLQEEADLINSLDSTKL